MSQRQRESQSFRMTNTNQTSSTKEQVLAVLKCYGKAR